MKHLRPANHTDDSTLVCVLHPSLHQQDFYAWTQQQADLLKSGSLIDLDTHYLIEELESMSASERRELSNRLIVLLAHLLKYRYQPKKRSKSWILTIKEQRVRVSLLLKQSPSLQSQLADRFTEAYEVAIISAARETGLPESTFPNELPFTLEQALDNTFLPQ